MTTAQPSVKSFIGVALEATKGTAVTATDFVPVKMSSLKPIDDIMGLYDDGLRGSLVEQYNYIPGRKSSKFDLGGSVFADTIGYWIASILGDVVTTGASAPYTHTIALKNSVGATGDAQPKSLTISDYNSTNNRQFPGCQVTDFGLTFSADGLLDYSVKMLGFPSAVSAIPTPSFGTLAPMPAWIGTVTIAGGSVINLQKANVDMTRKAEAIWALSNTQSPYQIFVGALGVKGKATFVMDADTELTRYLTNTQPTMVFNFSQGAGAAATQVQFTISKGAYVAAVVDRNKDYVEVSVDFDGLGNTTDVGATSGYSPIKWVLQNAKPSGTYQ